MLLDPAQPVPPLCEVLADPPPELYAPDTTPSYSKSGGLRRRGSGDLVWWPGHVGIYTGDGQHIAACSPNTLLHESPIWRADPTFIRVG